MLTDEAKLDQRLNPIDRNVLAVLQFIKDGKGTNEDGFFDIILKTGDGISSSLQGWMKGFGVPCDYASIMRSINKLERFGYLIYKRGFFNKAIQRGYYPKVKILKGTVDKEDAVSNNYSSESCGDIAFAKEKEKEKKKENENDKQKENESISASDISRIFSKHEKTEEEAVERYWECCRKAKEDILEGHICNESQLHTRVKVDGLGYEEEELRDLLRAKLKADKAL